MLALAANEVRTWTSTEGTTFRGTLLQVEPERVLIERASDKVEFWVQRNRFVVSDLLVFRRFEELSQYHEKAAQRMLANELRNGDFELKLRHWDIRNTQSAVKVISSSESPVLPTFFDPGSWMIKMEHTSEKSYGPPYITQTIKLPTSGRKLRIEVNIFTIDETEGGEKSGFFRLSLTDPDLKYYSRPGEPAPSFPYKSQYIAIGSKEWKKIIWEVEDNYIENRTVVVGVMGSSTKGHVYLIDDIIITPMDRK